VNCLPNYRSYMVRLSSAAASSLPIFCSHDPEPRKCEFHHIPCVERTLLITFTLQRQYRIWACLDAAYLPSDG
jgi:hypothetical protein